MTVERRVLNQIKIPVRWVDMDAYQHVNNARYFDYMSEARTVLFKLFPHEDRPCQFVVADTQCFFKRPLVYPMIVVVQQSIETLGSCSFTLHYEFTLEHEPSVLYAEGNARIVCYDPDKKRTIRIPEAILQVLNSPVLT